MGCGLSVYGFGIVGFWGSVFRACLVSGFGVWIYGPTAMEEALGVWSLYIMLLKKQRRGLLNPKPSRPLNPRPSTLNPSPQALHLSPKPETPNPTLPFPASPLPPLRRTACSETCGLGERRRERSIAHEAGSRRYLKIQRLGLL